jgi:prepilin-type N-terminal cleavage/methylation domain-containing protein
MSAAYEPHSVANTLPHVTLFEVSGMNRRRGLSLIEVLIAIFVMAIGMISLLVLFPLGMINASWAIKNNRISQAAANANSSGEMPGMTFATSQYSLRDDPMYRTIFTVPCPPTGTTYFYTDLFSNWSGSPNWTFSTLDPRSSMVVYVDPIGFNATSVTGLPPGVYLGGNFPPQPPITITVNGVPVAFTLVSIPRVPTYNTCAVNWTPATIVNGPFASNPVLAANQAKFLCSQEDDVTFYPDGSAVSNPVERGRRYSWAYVCRWPRYSDNSVVEMSIVMYSGRPQPLTGTGGQTISSEPAYLKVPNQLFQQGSTTVIIPQTPNQPWPITAKRGDWIMDATFLTPKNVNIPPIVSGYFYRIVNIGDPDLNLGIQEIQIDRPARASGFLAVFPQGVVDVREKSDGKMPVK